MIKGAFDKESLDMTIAEKLQFNTENEVYMFLTNLFKTQAVFRTPSGLFVDFSKYRVPATKNLAWRWFRELLKLPYREELPTVEELYHWSGTEKTAYEMNLFDKIYAVFSSPNVTGRECADDQRTPSPFYVKEGRLVCYFSHQEDERIMIPKNVDVIGCKSFYCAGFLKHVIVPQNVKLIEEDAFYIEDVESTELIFLEIRSKDTRIDGELSLGCKEHLEETGYDFRPFVIAPKFSRAWEFAKLRKYRWAEKKIDAIK